MLPLSLPLCPKIPIRSERLADFFITSQALALQVIIPILELTSPRPFPFLFNHFQEPILQPFCFQTHVGMGWVVRPYPTARCILNNTWLP